MAGEERRTLREIHSLPEIRTPPHNIDMEQAVLGTLLLENSAYQKVSDILTPQCFFDPLHRNVYEAMVSLLQQGRKADPITLRTYFTDQPLDRTGPPVREYLALLAREGGAVSDLRGYSMILLDLFVRRETIKICDETMERAYAAGVTDTSKALVETTVDFLSGLPLTVGEPDGPVRFGAVARSVMADLERDWREGTGSRGYSTGFPALDEAIGGLNPPDLVVIGGRPGSGKTALATNILVNIARQFLADWKAGLPLKWVVFFSLEMSKEQVVNRILSEMTGISAKRINERKTLSQEEVTRLAYATSDFAELPLIIEDKTFSISQIELKARAYAKRGQLDVMAVDYLQLIQPRSTKHKETNRNDVLTDISQSLKNLCKELDVPDLALAQVGRDVDKRPPNERRPRPSDFRESGSIEQDADIALMLYREEYYLKDEKPHPEHPGFLDWQRRMQQARGVAEVIVGKQRHGPTCTVVMGFDGIRTRFLNEPEPRETDLEPIRSKKSDEPKLGKDSPGVLSELAKMELQDYLPNVDLEHVPKWPKKVMEYAVWKERCVAQYCDGSETDAAKAKMMREAVTPLIRGEYIERSRDKDGRYVWLTEKGRHALPKKEP